MNQRLLTKPRIVLAVVVGGFITIAFLAAWQAGLLQPRLQRLIRQLQTAQEAEDRYEAAQELGEMGAAARPAVPALVAALDDDGVYMTTAMLIFPQEHYVRNAASKALGQIGGPEAVDALISVIATKGDSDWYTSTMAARLLGEFGAEARPGAERLLDAIDGCRQGEVVKQSLAALIAMQIEPGSPAADKARDVLPQFCNWGNETGPYSAGLLYRLWPDDEEALEYYVATMLSRRPPSGFGVIPINEQTIPLIINHLGDGTREAAITHLAAAKADQVVPPLTEALQRPEWLIRAGAATALAKHGAEAAAAEPELTALLADKNENVRLATATALWECAHQVEKVLPVLVAARKSQAATTRQSVQSFVYSRGSDDAWAVASLAQFAATERPKEERLFALELLSQIKSPTPESSEVLLELLRDPDADIQRAAAKAVAASEKK